MTIEECIRNQLEAGEKVILPGFGTMEIIDSGGGTPGSGPGSTTKRIDPPGKKVRFDSTYSKDDGRLAEAFSTGASLEKEEAGQQVLELVDAVRFALDKGEPYTLEGVGVFSRDDDGKIRFRTDSDWVIEPDQYGLEPMELLELEEEPAETISPEPETGIQPGSVPQEAPEKPATHEPWKRENSHRKTHLWKIIWGVAALLIIVLLVLIFLPADTFNFLGKKAHPESVETPAGESVESVETPAGESVEKSGGTPAYAGEKEGAAAEQQSQDNSKAAVSEDSRENTEVPLPVKRYYIVAGSFRNLANASELQDKLKGRGYPSEMIMTENRMYRVTVASYATHAEAMQSLSRIKSQSGLESCWLLSNE